MQMTPSRRLPIWLPVLLLAATLLSLPAATASAYMHPTAGRWLQRDPAGYVDGMGLYEYCRAQPTRRLDPYGRESTTVETYVTFTFGVEIIHRLYPTIELRGLLTGLDIDAINGMRKTVDYSDVLMRGRAKALDASDTLQKAGKVLVDTFTVRSLWDRKSYDEQLSEARNDIRSPRGAAVLVEDVHRWYDFDLQASEAPPTSPVHISGGGFDRASAQMSLEGNAGLWPLLYVDMDGRAEIEGLGYFNYDVHARCEGIKVCGKATIEVRDLQIKGTLGAPNGDSLMTLKWRTYNRAKLVFRIDTCKETAIEAPISSGSKHFNLKNNKKLQASVEINAMRDSGFEAHATRDQYWDDLDIEVDYEFYKKQ